VSTSLRKIAGGLSIGGVKACYQWGSNEYAHPEDLSGVVGGERSLKGRPG